MLDKLSVKRNKGVIEKGATVTETIRACLLA